MNLRLKIAAWLAKPHWALVLYQDGLRICVVDTFHAKAAADEAYEKLMTSTAATLRPQGVRYRVERLRRPVRSGERCVQHDDW